MGQRLAGARAVLVFFVAPLLGIGCGPGLDDAETPPRPSAAPVASAPPPVVPAIAQPATSGPCDPIQSSALTAELQARAPLEAPGMQPFGTPLCANVPEGGETATADFTLEQGYCYTVLGEALPPIAELDLSLDIDLVASAPALPVLGALGNRPLMVDTLRGLHAAMGTKQSCYTWALLPVQAKVIARSTKGGHGPVAAQIYRKKK